MTTVTAPATGSTMALPAARGRSGLAGAIRSELTKIRSTRSTYWTLLALVIVTVGLGALVSFGAAHHPGGIDSRRPCGPRARAPLDTPSDIFERIAVTDADDREMLARRLGRAPGGREV